MTTGSKNRLISAILDGDRSLANKLIDDWAVVHGYERALIEVLHRFLAFVSHPSDTLRVERKKR